MEVRGGRRERKRGGLGKEREEGEKERARN
jgi:hypothetical protein